MIGGPQSYYEILDIPPDATVEEIRAAYLRVKAAYSKDSLALYSLMDASENQRYIQQAEEAYRVLSNPEKRREYDRNHGVLLTTESLERDNVIHFDRVPPMEGIDSEDLLIPPTTDIETAQKTNAPQSSLKQSYSMEHWMGTTDMACEIQSDPMRPPPTEPYSPVIKTTISSPSDPPKTEVETKVPSYESRTQTQINREILTETEFRGSFLRKVREARQISIEEVADYTKIKRQYIEAIEEEDFNRLPAAVYVRGFVIQYAKMLRLPHDRVSSAFMNRYHLAKKNKAS
jgi:hypothetical protein